MHYLPEESTQSRPGMQRRKIGRINSIFHPKPLQPNSHPQHLIDAGDGCLITCDFCFYLANKPSANLLYNQIMVGINTDVSRNMQAFSHNLLC